MDLNVKKDCGNLVDAKLEYLDVGVKLEIVTTRLAKAFELSPRIQSTFKFTPS